MTTHHDDEITRYRARVDQIPERPEATPERAAISEERIAEIRAEADRVFRNQAGPLTRGVYQLMAEIERLEAVIAEREAEIGELGAEIARYRAWLRVIDEDPDGAERNYWAEKALAGDELPAHLAEFLAGLDEAVPE